MCWAASLGRCVKLAVMAAALAASQASLAHPHGTVQCGFAVDYKDGQPHRLTGRLLFDEAHSNEALAVLRDPVTQKLDDALQQRFLFGLKRQLARWSWLLAASSDGALAELTEASAPVLWWSADGRLGVLVDMSITGASTVMTGAAWTYSCQDPSRYWVSEFLQTQPAISVAGCSRAAISPALKVATGPLAGTVNVNVTCPP
jgi:Protein of unknown function (DUF1007)